MSNPRRHLKLLRSQSNYPTFRLLVALGFWLSIAIALLFPIAGLALIAEGVIQADGESLLTIFILLLMTCVQILAAKFFYECNSMLADIADGIVYQSAKKRDD
jgi:hypothetical protein